MPAAGRITTSAGGSAKARGAASSRLRRSLSLRAAAHICRTRDTALAAMAYTSAHKPAQRAGRRRWCQISSRLVARRCRRRCPASPESGMERPPRSIERWLPSSRCARAEPSDVLGRVAVARARRVGERACMVWEPDGRRGLRRPRGRQCSDLGPAVGALKLVLANDLPRRTLGRGDLRLSDASMGRASGACAARLRGTSPQCNGHAVARSSRSLLRYVPARFPISYVAPDVAHSSRLVHIRSAAAFLAWPPQALSFSLYTVHRLVCILAQSTPVSGPRCPLAALALVPPPALESRPRCVPRLVSRPLGNPPVTV